MAREAVQTPASGYLFKMSLQLARTFQHQGYDPCHSLYLEHASCILQRMPPLHSDMLMVIPPTQSSPPSLSRLRSLILHPCTP